jgi:hypothetical protein
LYFQYRWLIEFSYLDGREGLLTICLLGDIFSLVQCSIHIMCHLRWRDCCFSVGFWHQGVDYTKHNRIKCKIHTTCTFNGYVVTIALSIREVNSVVVSYTWKSICQTHYITLFLFSLCCSHFMYSMSIFLFPTPLHFFLMALVQMRDAIKTCCPSGERTTLYVLMFKYVVRTHKMDLKVAFTKCSLYRLGK